MNRYILTGTPGCGKTSIIRSLEKRGHFVIEEAATDVIAHEQAKGIPEPWMNPDFIDKIIHLQYQRQTQANAVMTPQFFDRSPICTYALAVYLGYPPSDALMEEIERLESDKVYEQTVFFLDNMGFCEPTEARKITFEESLIFEKIHLDSYLKFGYDLYRVPAKSIDERVTQVLNTVKLA